MPRSLWRYLWAAPTTALGLCLLPFAATVRRRDGVLEGCGGLLRPALRYLPPIPGGAAALTLGHVVVGRDEPSLAGCRGHELVHVRQCERWGPFFLPAYLSASAWALLLGRHPYHDNPFEREAVRACAGREIP